MFKPRGLGDVVPYSGRAARGGGGDAAVRPSVGARIRTLGLGSSAPRSGPQTWSLGALLPQPRKAVTTPAVDVFGGEKAAIPSADPRGAHPPPLPGVARGSWRSPSAAPQAWLRVSIGMVEKKTCATQELPLEAASVPSLQVYGALATGDTPAYGTGTPDASRVTGPLRRRRPWKKSYTLLILGDEENEAARGARPPFQA